VLHPRDPTRFAQPHRPHSRGGIPGDSPTTRARTGAPAHPGRSASRGARAKLSLTARLPVPRAALSAGRFAELRRSTSPTLLQSSSCARPDPHPVVGVRIGPNCSAPRSSGSVASSAGLRAALSLPPVGWRRCSPRSRRTGATRWRRLPHPALSAQPERGFGRPLRGFPRRCRALPGAAVVAPGVITLTPPKGPGSARCDALSPFRVPASPPGARLPSQPHDPRPGGSTRKPPGIGYIGAARLPAPSAGHGDGHDGLRRRGRRDRGFGQPHRTALTPVTGDRPRVEQPHRAALARRNH
jgi:hypothetical protein